MLQLKYLKILSLILLLSSLVGCAWLLPKPETKIVTVTETVKPVLQKTARPKAVTLNTVEFKVVTEQNLDQFLKDFKEANGNVVFYAITVSGYESMAINLAELRRYILQQKEVILYYETMVDNNNEKPK